MAKRPSNRLVRKAIREILEPQIIALGFAGKYPEFSRISGREIHFIHFQTAKYGGSFTFSGAWARAGSADSIAETDFDNRATAVHVIEMGLIESQRMAWRSQGHFHYDVILQDETACRKLVEDAAAVIPAMDHWLKTREPSLAIDCKGHRMRQAESPLSKWHKANSMVGAFDINAKMPSTPQLDAQRAANMAPEYFIN